MHTRVHLRYFRHLGARRDSSSDLQFQLVSSLSVHGVGGRREMGEGLGGILKNLTATDLAYILHSPMKFCGPMVAHHRL